MAAVFSKAGVAPDFFSSFPFLKFLDNSTDHWKSRFATMKHWTPNQRIAWYIDKINNEGNPRYAIQYSEMYGTLHDNLDDTRSVDYNMAKLFNDLVKEKLIGSDGRVGGYEINRILCDLDKAINKPVLTLHPTSDFFGNPIVKENPISANLGTDASGSTKKMSIFGNIWSTLLILGAFVGMVFFIERKPSKKRRR